MPPLDLNEPGLLAVIEKTADSAARKALAGHRKACPVDKIATEIWGNGRDGLKQSVHELLQARKRADGWVFRIVPPLIVAALVSLAAWVIAAQTIHK